MTATIDLIQQYKLVVFPYKDGWMAGRLAYGKTVTSPSPYCEESSDLESPVDIPIWGKTIEEAVQSVVELIERE